MVDHNPTPTIEEPGSFEKAMRDPDGLAHYTMITSQEELRKIVETAVANGRRGGLDEASKARTKYEAGLAAEFRAICTREGLDPDKTALKDLCHHIGGRAGLQGQEDGHAEGYAKAAAEFVGMRDTIVDLGTKLLDGPSAKLQSQADSLRSELAASRAHVAELTAKLDGTKREGVRINITVDAGGTVNVHTDSEHAP